MTRRRYYALVLLVVIGIILFTVFFTNKARSESPYTIVRTTEGFEPAELIVPVGTEVLFKNESERPFWPASNVHPYHNVYPEFDPREPIAPGESWVFTFDVEGNWLYHDHLAATKIGVVIVNAASVAAAGELPSICPGTTPFERRACWNQRLTRAFNDGGLESAFDEMSALFAQYPGFAPQCHQFGHDLGLLARIRYGDDVPLLAKAGYCNESFYHGYMQGFLEEHQGNVQKAAQFCERVRSAKNTHPLAVNQCKHGTGHGLMEYQLFERSELWMGRQLPELVQIVVAQCDEVFDVKDDLFRCASGAYNVLVDWLPLQNGYGALFSREDPFRLCSVPQEEWARSACAWEFAKALRHLEPDQFRQIELMVKSASEFEGGVYLRSIVESHGMSIASQHWQESDEKLVSYCHAVGTSLAIPCLQGMVTRLFKYGPPGRELERPLRFCSVDALSAPERTACAKKLLENVTSSHLPPATYGNACREIVRAIPDFVHNCDTL